MTTTFVINLGLMKEQRITVIWVERFLLFVTKTIKCSSIMLYFTRKYARNFLGTYLIHLSEKGILSSSFAFQ